MDNTTGNSNQTITTPNADDLSKSAPQPLMVTEPVISDSTVISNNPPAEPKLNEPAAFASTAIPEPTVSTVSKPDVPEPAPAADNMAVPAPDINTPEEQAISDPGYTFNSDAPVNTVNVSSPSSAKRSNAPFYLGLVVLFLALSIPMTVYLNQKARTQTNAKTNPVTNALSLPNVNITFYKPEASVIQPTAVSDQYQTLVVKNLAWLNAQKTPENTYYFSQITKNGTVSTSKTVDNRIGLYPAWAKYNHWKKTQNPELLTSLAADLSTLADPTKTVSYQPDFWSCKLLYQISIDPTVPKNIQDNAVSICNRASIGIISFDIIENPGKPESSQYPEVDLTSIFGKNTSTPVAVSGWNNFLNFFINNSAFVSDNLAKAWWTSDGQYLAAAKNAFNYAVSNYQRLSQVGSIPEACVLGISSLDMYITTKENKYLTFSQNLFERESKNISPNSDVFAKFACMMLAKNLNAVSQDPKYQTYLADKINDLIKNNYDDKSGGFYTKLGTSIYMYTKHNGLISAFLSSL